MATTIHHTDIVDGNTALSKFLANSIALLDLGCDENDRMCSICLEHFTAAGAGAPVQLHCGHIFGNECLEHWLALNTTHPNGSCPMCRSKLVEYQGCATVVLPSGILAPEICDALWRDWIASPDEKLPVDFSCLIMMVGNIIRSTYKQYGSEDGTKNMGCLQPTYGAKGWMNDLWTQLQGPVTDIHGQVFSLGRVHRYLLCRLAGLSHELALHNTERTRLLVGRLGSSDGERQFINKTITRAIGWAKGVYEKQVKTVSWQRMSRYVVRGDSGDRLTFYVPVTQPNRR